MRFHAFVVSIAMLTLSNRATAGERVLFDFDDASAARAWQTVNDGVMGGRSDGRRAVTEDGTLRFFGTLSLANNGGFASVRVRGVNLGLRSGDTIVARVRGDGRKYSLNLYTPTRRTAFSYRTNFETEKDTWIEVAVPVSDFVATSFGQTIQNSRLDPPRANGIGILLGDKKPGQFNLEVDWIKVRDSKD